MDPCHPRRCVQLAPTQLHHRVSSPDRGREDRENRESREDHEGRAFGVWPDGHLLRHLRHRSAQHLAGAGPETSPTQVPTR